QLYLSDVMERRRAAKRPDPLAVPPQLERDGLGEGRDAVAVAERLVALLERAGEGGEHARQGFPARAQTPTSPRCRRSAFPCGSARAAAGPRRPRSFAEGRSGSSP